MNVGFAGSQSFLFILSCEKANILWFKQFIFLSYVVSHEARERRRKKNNIKQNEYPPVRQNCIQFVS